MKHFKLAITALLPTLCSIIIVAFFATTATFNQEYASLIASSFFTSPTTSSLLAQIMKNARTFELPIGFENAPLSYKYRYLLDHFETFSLVQRIMMAACLFEYPVQIPVTNQGLDIVVDMFLAEFWVTYIDKFDPKLRGRSPPIDFGSLEWCKLQYPLKPHPGAKNKQGCYSHDMFMAVRDKYDLFNVVKENWYYLSGLTDDQVSCVLIYMRCSGSRLGYLKAFKLAIMGCCSPSTAKNMSTMIKSLGWNANILGAMLCELNTLAGRGIAPINMVDEVARRCGSEGVSTVVNVDADVLRKAVRQVYAEELSHVEAGSMADWFYNRWLYVANGAHSERAYTMGTHTRAHKLQKVGARIHRKAYIEHMTYMDLLSWDGRVIVGPSEKQEHGKSRALFSCDTVSQMYFAYILGAVEKTWSNIHCILDPGRMGVVGIGQLLYKLKCNYPYMLMADFDDFNSQHSNEAQKIVFEELKQYVHADPYVWENIINSFDNTYIVNAGVESKVTGTLMSGHRGTTFINTVLNRAYMQVAHDMCGVNINGKHVGDDIIGGYSSMDDIKSVMDAASLLGLRLNRSKQSMGKYGMEFLRVAYDDRGDAYGYVARAIAGYVSGNWCTQHTPEPDEALRGAVCAVYTIMNRCADRTISNCFVYAVCRRTQVKHDVVSKILNGEIALGDGPVWNKLTVSTVQAVILKSDPTDIISPGQVPHEASTDYAVHTMNPIDRALYEHFPDMSTQLLVASSYYKDMKSNEVMGHVGELRVHYAPPNTLRMNTCVSYVLRMRPQVNDLMSSPIFMSLVRTRSTRDIDKIVSYALPQYAFGQWRKMVYDHNSGHNSFYGWLAFSDMMAINNRVSGALVRHDIGNYYV